MKLHTKCTTCREFINFKTPVVDRYELVKEMGEWPQLTCHHCHSTSNYHINDIRAVPNKRIGWIAVLTFVLVAGLTLVFVLDDILSLHSFYAMVLYVALIAFPFLIFEGFNGSQRQLVNNFNTTTYG